MGIIELAAAESEEIFKIKEIGIIQMNEKQFANQLQIQLQLPYPIRQRSVFHYNFVNYYLIIPAIVYLAIHNSINAPISISVLSLRKKSILLPLLKNGSCVTQQTVI